MCDMIIGAFSFTHLSPFTIILSMMLFCTHAITGSQYPSHQPIYICDTCVRNDEDSNSDANYSSNERATTPPPPLPCCICQSCAEVCHADHDVSYVGIGPCTCDCLYLQSDAATDSSTNLKLLNDDESDCNEEEEEEGGATNFRCKLADHSMKEATKLGFNPCRPLNAPLRLIVPPPLSETNTTVEAESTNNNTDDDYSSTGIDYNTTCVECNSTIGGYVYESYTIRPGHIIISSASENDVGNNIGNDANDDKEKNLRSFCDNLISQAIALDACSQDTFWMPASIGDNCNEQDDIDDVDNDGNRKGDRIDMSDNKVDGGYSDLELFAREVYQHHVQSYTSHLTTSNKDINAEGGAEWWVQVKPAGSSRAPVNMHYDKDETLAEAFGLGSFPTLSTVTYLTDSQDNVPTIVFPRTYNDEIDLPIESMLVSHAVRGKHLVFDGRLLHGAPAHQSLLRQSCNRNAEYDECQPTSSLRVTLLVNIWLSGKPACVNVLPVCIRSKIQCIAKMEPTMSGRSLRFSKRHVSNLSFRAGAFAKSIDDDDDDYNVAGREMIILPFVSNDDAYAGVDAGNVDDGNEEASAKEESSEEEICDANEVLESDEVAEEHDDEETDEELYLVVSHFSTAEYTKNKSDTFVVSFGDGNGARIVRGDALDETSNRLQCPWKFFPTSNIANGVAGDRCITDAAAFLSYLEENVPSFITSVLDELKMRYDMDLTMHQADHVCYRTESIEGYSGLVNALRAATNDFRILTESAVGGRPISTFKLTTPITFDTTDGNRILDVIEIPSPKEGSPYHAGLEHVEFVIGDGSHASPMRSEAHHIALTGWMDLYSSTNWNRKALNKACNPDVNVKLSVPKYGAVSVKFHLIPLEDVIKFEESRDKQLRMTGA